MVELTNALWFLSRPSAIKEAEPLVVSFQLITWDTAVLGIRPNESTALNDNSSSGCLQPITVCNLWIHNQFSTICSFHFIPCLLQISLPCSLSLFLTLSLALTLSLSLSLRFQLTITCRLNSCPSSVVPASANAISKEQVALVTVVYCGGPWKGVRISDAPVTRGNQFLAHDSYE